MNERQIGFVLGVLFTVCGTLSVLLFRWSARLRERRKQQEAGRARLAEYAARDGEAADPARTVVTRPMPHVEWEEVVRARRREALAASRERMFAPLSEHVEGGA